MLEALKKANARRWSEMTIDRNLLPELDRVARRLIAAKPRYQQVSLVTNVPWPVIADIHEREASQSWMANLAQGDRWDRVSVHVPRGEGPFPSWEAAAKHALIQDDHLNTWGDWSIGGTLTAWEKFNGTGYYDHGHISPYVWAYSNEYSHGKYTSDGHYDDTYVDRQMGAAPLLARMMLLDPTIGADYKWTVPVGASAPSTITVGASHDTSWVQESLNKLGAFPQITVDGDYGPKTKAAVRQYQERKGLLNDGKFGPHTSAAIEADLKALETPLTGVV